MIIFLNVIAFTSLVSAILYNFGFTHLSTSPIGQIAFASAIFVAFPVALYFSIKKSYRHNPFLQSDIQYEFTPNNFKVSGNSFFAEMSWESMKKIVEFHSWFLIFDKTARVQIIPKNQLDEEKTIELRTFFRELNGIKRKLRK